MKPFTGLLVRIWGEIGQAFFKMATHQCIARGVIFVVSDKMDKTIVVLVEERKKHPLYGKVMRLSKKIKAHDEQNTAGIGDLVLINETRPLSATKNWRLVEILEKAK